MHNHQAIYHSMAQKSFNGYLAGITLIILVKLSNFYFQDYFSQHLGFLMPGQEWSIVSFPLVFCVHLCIPVAHLGCNPNLTCLHTHTHTHTHSHTHSYAHTHTHHMCIIKSITEYCGQLKLQWKPQLTPPMQALSAKKIYVKERERDGVTFLDLWLKVGASLCGNVALK